MDLVVELFEEWVGLLVVVVEVVVVCYVVVLVSDGVVVEVVVNCYDVSIWKFNGGMY